MSGGSILVEGRTCWRRPHAGRLALLVDGAAYFAALASSIERAERSILMVGWDFHSRVRLRRDGGADSTRDELVELLAAQVRRRPRLHVNILEWDFAMIYALEREALPLFRLGVRTPRRIHFRFDDRHPLGASHHQKIVVVDDAIAFCGGLDLAACRWDTREHPSRDPRRSDPGFPDYPPFHDVQMAVDGEAASALAELVRERWRRATGRRLSPVRVERDPWPEGLEPQLEDVAVGISRTEPAWDGRAAVHEVEALYVDALRRAQRFVYVENQYLTSQALADVLEERLGQPSGPEIVIVLPRTCSGWLEERTMGLLRARVLERLRKADHARRLRVYHPLVPGLGERPFIVHGKVLVVDDQLLRVGSANLANRSMGLDTECDLSLESGGEARVARAIGRLRNDLLAEHLGATPEEVAARISAHGSLIQAIESLRGGERSLEPLDAQPPEWPDLLPEPTLADPERPVEFDQLMARLVPEELSELPRPLRRRLLLGGGALLLLALTWRTTPLAEWLAPERLAALADSLQGIGGPVLGAGIVALASLLLVPITALVVASGLVFGWWQGALASLAGALASAGLGYLLGRVLWRDAVRRLAGRRLNRLSRRLARRGMLAIAAVRLLPVAPFTVVNLVAGASHLRFRDYLNGTLLAMTPGIVGLALLGDRGGQAWRQPDAAGWIWVLVVAVLLAAGLRLARRQVGRAEARSGTEAASSDAR